MRSSPEVVNAGKQQHLNHAGLKLFTRDIGTGYHQPEGIVIWNGKLSDDPLARKEIDSRSFAPEILNSFQVSVPSYMHSFLLDKTIRA